MKEATECWRSSRAPPARMAAAVLLAAVAAVSQSGVLRPAAAQPAAQQSNDNLSELNGGFFTPVAGRGNFSGVRVSGQANDAADDRGGAIQGSLEPNMAREQVVRTQVVPYRYVGFLRCADGTRCTAALISPEHVLTAGHCVYDYRGTHMVRDPHPRFWPALSNNDSTISPPEAPFGVYRVEDIVLPRQFTALNSNQAFDLAVLRLERPVAGVGGFFQGYDCFSAHSPSARPAGAERDANGSLPSPPPPPPPATKAGQPERDLESDPSTLSQVAFRLNVAGYPANSDREMWAAFCSNVTFDTSDVALVQHDCDTYSGMSGSPLWEYEPASNSNARRICAVHKADALVSTVENLAVPLYAEAVRFIDRVLAGQAPRPVATAQLADSQGRG